MAINIGLVSVALLTMVTIYNHDFEQMIAAQATTEALSDENFRLASRVRLRRPSIYRRMECSIQVERSAQRSVALTVHERAIQSHLLASASRQRFPFVPIGR